MTRSTGRDDRPPEGPSADRLLYVLLGVAAAAVGAAAAVVGLMHLR